MNARLTSECVDLVKASSLYQDFVTAIMAPQVTHVSFDIFDTVLRRICHEPKQVFANVVEQLPQNVRDDFCLEAVDYQQMRIAAERLARQASAVEEISLDDIFSQMALPLHQLQLLKQQEIEQELAQSFADPVCAILLEAVKESGKQLVFISDMYLPSSVVKQLIDNSCDLEQYRLFVSSDYGQTKFTGQLFERVLVELGIEANAIVHIGDHATSDVRSPQMMGITAFLFSTNKEFSDILLREKHYQVHLPSKVKLARTLASVLVPAGLSDDAQFFYQMGATIFGPILTQMSQWLVADCQRLKIDTMLAIMREGEIFSECINRQLQWQVSIDPTAALFRCVNFYASRKATYLPSMINANIEDTLAKTLARKCYTLGDMLSEFDISSPELVPLLSTPVGSLNKIDIAGQNGLARVKLVFANAAHKVNSTIRDHHHLFIEYLQQILSSEAQAFATLDLGPGATIAQQLAKASEHRARINYLLFASERGFSKANDIAIKSFFPLTIETQKAIAIIVRSHEVLEYFLVGESGTTLGYQRQTGQVLPVCETRHLSATDMLHHQVFRRGVHAFQQLALSIGLAPASFDERISYAQLLTRLIDCPTATEVAYIGQCQHEENFGSQGKYSIIKADNLAKVESKGVANFYTYFCEQATALQRNMPWPQGVITQLAPHYLTDIARVNAQEHVHFSAVQSLLSVLVSDGIEEIMVYGAGDFFLYLYDFLVEQKILVRGVIDRRAEFSSFSVYDIPVKSLAEADLSHCHTIVIASSAFVDEIKQDLEKFITAEDYKIIAI